MTLFFIREETIIINSLFKNKYPETRHKIYCKGLWMLIRLHERENSFSFEDGLSDSAKHEGTAGCWCPRPGEAHPEPAGCGHGDAGGAQAVLREQHRGSPRPGEQAGAAGWAAGSSS